MWKSVSGKMPKQGFSADIFKWIFGVVAGALVLFFLVRFAMQHIELRTTLNVRELTEYFDDQLEAFRIAESSSKIIQIERDAAVKITCEGFGIGDAFKQSNRIIFAPDNLEGEIAAWTEVWKFPFWVEHFYYLADANLRILFVYDDTSSIFVRNLELPSIFRFQKMQLRNFAVNRLQRESAGERVNVVFFTAVPNVAEILRKVRRAHVVEVSPVTKTVTYHNTNTKRVYYGDEMLYGAFFAPESFGCSQKKALERLHLVVDVYLRKVELLRLKAHDRACETGLAEVKKTLEAFLNPQEPERLYTLKETLEEQNRFLRRSDCAVLY